MSGPISNPDAFLRWLRVVSIMGLIWVAAAFIALVSVAVIYGEHP